MNSIVITPLVYADISACAALFSETFQAAWAQSWSIEAANRRLQHLVHCPGAMAWTARIHDELAGFLIAIEEPWIQAPLCRIEELSVAVKYQRLGVGQQLMQHLETVCQQRNIPTMFLTTAQGTTAEKFYRQMGFAESLMQHMAKRVASF